MKVVLSVYSGAPQFLDYLKDTKVIQHRVSQDEVHCSSLDSSVGGHALHLGDLTGSEIKLPHDENRK